METYTLQGEEILYLAALTGAETFYGVEDTLSPLPDMQLKTRVMELEDALGKKGYMRTDFDGNTELDEDLMRLIAECGGSGNIIMFEKETAEDGQSGALYFACSGDAVRMTGSGVEHTFSVMEPGEMKDEIFSGIFGRKMSTPAENGRTYRILQKDVEKARKLARRGAGEKAGEVLTAAGLDDRTAETVIDGFGKRADFYSLLFLNREAEGTEETAVSILLLIGQDMVEMRWDSNEKDEDCVIFRLTGEKEQRARIEAGFDLMECFDFAGQNQDPADEEFE